MEQAKAFAVGVKNMFLRHEEIYNRCQDFCLMKDKPRFFGFMGFVCVSLFILRITGFPMLSTVCFIAAGYYAFDVLGKVLGPLFIKIFLPEDTPEENHFTIDEASSSFGCAYFYAQQVLHKAVSGLKHKNLAYCAIAEFAIFFFFYFYVSFGDYFITAAVFCGLMFLPMYIASQSGQEEVQDNGMKKFNCQPKEEEDLEKKAE